MPLRLIFMGTPDFAVPTLRALHEHGHQIIAVYTRAAKPAKRGMKVQQTPVEQEAGRLGIRVVTPTTLRGPEAEVEFLAHNADAAVVVAYGMILPQAILDAPKYGCFNLHASLLPRWRGAAPIHRAVMEGDTKSGVMVMKMDAGLDTGDIVSLEGDNTTKITNTTTTADLHERLALLGADLMIEAMSVLEQGKLQRLRQDSDGVTYAHKVEKGEARIDWNKPRKAVLRHINGLSTFPGAWSEVEIKSSVVRIKILRCSLVPGPRRKLLPLLGTLLDDRFAIACMDGAIRVLDLQLAGGQAMKAADFLRGTPLKPPARLL